MSFDRLYIWMLMLLFGFKVQAQSDSALQIRVGLISNKMLGFYWLNGLSAELNSKKLCKGSFDLGLNIYSSSLGSAFLSNAIPVHAMEATIQKRFRAKRKVNPVIGLNVGFAKAFYGSNFEQLKQSSLLLAPEFGVNYVVGGKLSARFCLGYNSINGTGVRGPGFVYPVCLRFKLIYSL